MTVSKRALAMTVGLVAVVAAGGSAGLSLGASDERPRIAPRPAADDRPAAGTARVTRDEPDPAGDGRWALQRYTSVGGNPCVRVGELRAGVLGRRVGSDFVEQTDDHIGACSVGGVTTLAITRQNDIAATQERESRRTLVYGVGGSDVVEVVITAGDQQRRVRVADGGEYLAVLDGLFGQRDPVVELRPQ